MNFKTKYYPCDICGNNSPSNKQFTDKNSIKTSYCLMHYWRVAKDYKKSIERAKNHQKFIEEFNKAFVNPDY